MLPMTPPFLAHLALETGARDIIVHRRAFTKSMDYVVLNTLSESSKDRALVYSGA